MSQADAVLAMLRERPEGITPLDALREVGCFRLAAVVFDLRAEGFPIVTTMEEAPNGRSHYARYTLPAPPRKGVAAGQLPLSLCP